MSQSGPKYVRAASLEDALEKRAELDGGAGFDTDAKDEAIDPEEGIIEDNEFEEAERDGDEIHEQPVLDDESGVST